MKNIKRKSGRMLSLTAQYQGLNATAAITANWASEELNRLRT